MKSDNIKFKSNFLIDREVKKHVVIFMFLRIKPLDSKGDMNITIVQYNKNDSNENEDINSLNESISSIQDEVNINNEIIMDKKKILQKVYPNTNCKPKIMMIILMINNVTKMIIIRTIIIHRIIV